MNHGISKACLFRVHGRREPFCRHREEGIRRKVDSPWEDKPWDSRKEPGKEGSRRKAHHDRAWACRDHAWEPLGTDTTSY